jgi:glycosyltransferase involved in cell wall biosynthesis
MKDIMDDPRPLVSVLVPVYNTPAAYLVEFCESLVAQSYPHFECIFLDDGSSEDALEILDNYRQDSRFTFFRWEKNRGLNCAWFQLLTKAQGRYWCSPGSDDVLTPKFLEKRVALLEAHPYAVFANGPPEVIDDAGNRCREYPEFGRIPKIIEAEKCLETLLGHCHVNQPGVLARVDLTRLVLSQYAKDWKYAADWYLWILLVALGQPVVWDPEPLHKYRLFSNSLSRDQRKEMLRRAENRLVPMCALAASARSSHLALNSWSRHRSTLYYLWLRRAVGLALQGRLEKEWVIRGSQAYYGEPKALPFWLEVGRNAFGIVGAALTEKRDAPHQNGLGWQDSRPLAPVVEPIDLRPQPLTRLS